MKHEHDTLKILRFLLTLITAFIAVFNY